MTTMELHDFLQAVDLLFPTPLSHKQDLHLLADKLCTLGTICAKEEDGRILALVAGYTNNDPAYISVAASLPEAQGKGYASQLVREFISVAREKGLSAVHLYAVSDNLPAMHLYQKLGFVPYRIQDEPRPTDAHLIYYIDKESRHSL